MPSACDSVRTIISSLLGREGIVLSNMTEADVESAFKHLKWCRACRSTLSPEDRARFLSNAILERE